MVDDYNKFLINKSHLSGKFGFSWALGLRCMSQLNSEEKE